VNLSQMFALCNSKTSYSRSEGEIYAALSRSGFRVYSAVLKEFRGFFLKFDESSLTLVPNTQEYAMPADFSQMVHLSERVSASENWRPMAPIDLDTAVNNVQQALGWEDFYSSVYGNQSEFGYYGPYLDSAATKLAQPLQIQKIRITPNPGASHFCQLAYTAKWLPINDASSLVMLPDEGTYAMESFASAELCGINDDTRASFYEAKGQSDLSAFLSWVRNRQIQTVPTIDMYGPA
jgi:hypothetical protein